MCTEIKLQRQLKFHIGSTIKLNISTSQRVAWLTLAFPNQMSLQVASLCRYFYSLKSWCLLAFLFVHVFGNFYKWTCG